MWQAAHLHPALAAMAGSLRYTNQELHNAVDQAVRDERLKTELITNVSHDLNTPITSIITYTDLLLLSVPSRTKRPRNIWLC